MPSSPTQFLSSVVALLLLVGCNGGKGGGDAVFFDGDSGQAALSAAQGQRRRIVALARRIATGGHGTDAFFVPGVCDATASPECALLGSLTPAQFEDVAEFAKATLTDLVSKSEEAPVTRIELATAPLFLLNLSVTPPTKLPVYAMASFEQNEILIAPAFANLTEAGQAVTIAHELGHLLNYNGTHLDSTNEAKLGWYGAGMRLALQDAPPPMDPDTAFHYQNGASDLERGLLTIAPDKVDAKQTDVYQESARGTVIQPDGKILLSGTFRTGGADATLFVARVLPNGNLDPAFGSGGIFRFRRSNHATYGDAIALMPGGQILAIGRVVQAPRSDLVLVKLDAAGALVPDYGNAGSAVVLLRDNDSTLVNAALSAPDGSVYAVGRSCKNGFCLGLLMKLTPAGLLDATFGDESLGPGTAEVLRRDQRWNFNGLALDPGNRLVVVGETMGSGNTLIARYLPDGKGDRTFGRTKSGYDSWNYASSALTERFRAVTVNDRGITVCGISGAWSMAMRFLEDGALDPAFGRGGRLGIGVGGECFALQNIAGGRVLAAVERKTTTDMVFALFNHAGELDARLGPDGKRAVYFPFDNVRGRELVVQPSDGMLLIYGSSTSTFQLFLKRVWPPGAI